MTNIGLGVETSVAKTSIVALSEGDIRRVLFIGLLADMDKFPMIE